MTDVIQIRDLSKSFQLGVLGAVPGLGKLTVGFQLKGIAHRVDAVNGLSLNVLRGEIFGFLVQMVLGRRRH